MKTILFIIIIFFSKAISASLVHLKCPIKKDETYIYLSLNEQLETVTYHGNSYIREKYSGFFKSDSVSFNYSYNMPNGNLINHYYNINRTNLQFVRKVTESGDNFKETLSNGYCEIIEHKNRKF
jgi:hypothetical protein